MTTIWLLLAVFAAPASPQGAPDPGARAFQRCSACHSLQSDDEAAPRLGDVFGRRAGGVRGFAYSDAMKAAGRRGLVWDAPTLERFLADPDAVVPRHDHALPGRLGRGAQGPDQLVAPIERTPAQRDVIGPG